MTPKCDREWEKCGGRRDLVEVGELRVGEYWSRVEYWKWAIDRDRDPDDRSITDGR